MFWVIIMIENGWMDVSFVFCMAQATSYTKFLKIIWNILFYKRTFKLKASFLLSEKLLNGQLHHRNHKKTMLLNIILNILFYKVML